MLSYQHAYHAGGPADLHKHLAFAELLATLTSKPRGISCFETHAGRGRYDLASPEALRTAEAARGIARIAPSLDSPFGMALAAARSVHGASAYPGSPLIAQALLRPQDRITLMEMHPAEHTALRANVTGATVAIHRRDGFEGVLALVPPRPRKGLVLVDPSYEMKSEYRAAGDFVRQLVVRWPEAVVLIWYPLLSAARHGELLAALAPLPVLRDEVRFDPEPDRGMTGSGLALINAPFGATRIFQRVHAQATPVLRPA